MVHGQMDVLLGCWSLLSQLQAVLGGLLIGGSCDLVTHLWVCVLPPSKVVQ